jgi:hypothetical protein
VLFVHGWLFFHFAVVLEQVLRGRLDLLGNVYGKFKVAILKV